MREFGLRLGKTFIVFSIVILFLGLSLTIDANRGQSSTIISNYNGDIPNTTIEDTNNTGITTVTPNTNNSNLPTGNTSDAVINSNPNTDSNNNVTPPVVPNNTTSSTIDPYVVSNMELKNIIYNTYGVTVKYGAETDGYVVGGYDVISCYDEVLINRALLLLQENMALYPNNFFKEISSFQFPLTIYLIKNYSSANITGITEKTVRNTAIISISLDYIDDFSNTFNHENYHYMEHYINMKDGKYTNWNIYNPSGFIYGRFDSKLVYNLTFSKDSYFVNSYSQSYEYEDRASLFEFMMAKTKISPLNEGNNLWKKAKVMCETIDYYFTTVNDQTTEYWERFIY